MTYPEGSIGEGFEKWWEEKYLKELSFCNGYEDYCPYYQEIGRKVERQLEYLGERWLVSVNTNEILNEWVVNLGRKDWKRNPEYKNAHAKTLAECLEKVLEAKI